MSDKASKLLTNVSLVVGILIGVFGSVGAWAVYPYRLEAAEKRLDILEHDMQKTLKEHGELLARIDERLKAIKP